MSTMRYRLALDLGSTSLGWAMIRLATNDTPCALIKAGVRIFSDGRNPKDGSSLAVTRREKRAMRRRRDRLLKRKARMLRLLIEHGFFPADEAGRRAFLTTSPFFLREEGLQRPLLPGEFARALFHINQRRGFRSNRKTDKKDNDSGALKTAIGKLRQDIIEAGCQTVGEYLSKRLKAGESVRARYRETKRILESGKSKVDKSYDLYIDRAMIETEFDTLWAKQAEFNVSLFNEAARADLKDCLLYQRALRPVKPGRCTLIPEEERAPLALPSTQRFRIFQEVNNLRVLHDGFNEISLTLAQRNLIVHALENNSKRTFKQIKTLLGFRGVETFNLEDAKREELKGNATSAALSRLSCFGDAWGQFSPEKQDAIVLRLLNDENETQLVEWLQAETGVDEAHAEAIATAVLPEGYGRLCASALTRILPYLQAGVVSYADAAASAGFHHSQLAANVEVAGLTASMEHINLQTGEIKTYHRFKQLPYYGEALQRHVSFGSGKLEDPPEKRFGKIANPTVHIGLNQVRVLVNQLIRRYGHPDEIIVELARDLKQSKDQKAEDSKRQADNQNRNARIRKDIAPILGVAPERVRYSDLQKVILWEELSRDVADRRCPYSGVQIGLRMLLSEQVEVDHILPFSRTLDDSLNNKTVAMRQANRIKGNRTPWEARHDFTAQGWATDDMLARAEAISLRNKRYRFGEDGYQRWLKEDQDFLARALNDTRYLSRVAREYLSLICPTGTRVIPGQMTAMLRAKFGLNDILGLDGEKNRNDHRHHALDASEIAVTDQGLLQRFANASASARELQLDKLVESMPLPWPTYREHVQRAIDHIWVSHKPDHGYEGGMMEETTYGIGRDGSIRQKVGADGEAGRTIQKLILITEPTQLQRHGVNADGNPLPYKGYVGGSNYCIEIVRNAKGKWEGEVISTFEAYQTVRKYGIARLRHPSLSLSNKTLVMRLMIGDYVKASLKGSTKLLLVKKLNTNGQIFFSGHNEANVRQRNDSKDPILIYGSFTAGALQKSGGRMVTISPIGEITDPGFRE